MTPVEKGRFCNSCKKKVYDFRNADPEEVKNVFKKTKGEACATFYEDQINQGLKYSLPNASIYNRLKVSAATAIAALSFKFFAIHPSFGQTTSGSSSEILYPINQVQDAPEITKVIKGRVVFKGTSDGLDYITVNLKRKHTTIATVITDDEGSFSFELKDSVDGAGLFLETVSKKNRGYNTVSIIRSSRQKVNLNKPGSVTIEVVYRKRKMPFKKDKRKIRTGRYRLD